MIRLKNSSQATVFASISAIFVLVVYLWSSRNGGALQKHNADVFPMIPRELKYPECECEPLDTKIEPEESSLPEKPVYAPAENDTFSWYEEPWAHETQSYEEEWERLLRFLNNYTVTCRAMRKMGGQVLRQMAANGIILQIDGEYSVCVDPVMKLKPGICVVYSVGIGDDWSFDEAMEKIGCKVFSLDPSLGKPDHFHSENIYFLNAGLCAINHEHDRNLTKRATCRNLAGLLEELNHKERVIDVLKIDIEGGEFRALPKLLEDGTLRSHVKQLHLELHLHDMYHNASIARQRYSMLYWLHRQGFRLFTKRINEWWTMGYEVGFLNTILVPEILEVV